MNEVMCEEVACMFLIVDSCRYLQIIRNKFATLISKLVESVFFEVLNQTIRNGHFKVLPYR